jgi:hypothetical protein
MEAADPIVVTPRYGAAENRRYQEDRDNRNASLRTAKLSNLITLSGVVITILSLIGVAMTIRQSQRAMELDQRAWVGIKNVSPWIDEQGKIGAEIDLDNTGKTPALNVRAKENIEPLAIGGLWNQEPNYPQDYSTSQFAAKDSLQVIAPNSSFKILVSINGEWTEGLTDALHGRIIYDDVFGCHHWVVFCYLKRSNRRTGVFWTPCSMHNDIDLTDELTCVPTAKTFKSDTVEPKK